MYLFQANFYITDEELELARQGPGTSFCPLHEQDNEPLKLYCKPCDQAICTLCKLTDHEGHRTEHLSKAAERCIKELKATEDTCHSAIKHLTKKLEQAHEDLKNARLKAEAIKEHVRV
jgi:hypothetical protein